MSGTPGAFARELSEYRGLPASERLDAAFDRSVAGKAIEIPGDWTVYLSDVVGSTKAIAEGRYKEVNTAGSLPVMAIANLVGDMNFPFVFGGDGMTAVLPPGCAEQVRAIMRDTRRMARELFAIELRTGAVPVSELRRRDAPLSVAAVRVSDRYRQAVFFGSGLDLAEEMVKGRHESAEAREPWIIPDAPGAAAVADFTGFSCRWRDIPSPRGITFALVVKPGPAVGRTDTGWAERVLRVVRSSIGDDECTTCAACASVCHVGIDFAEFWEKVREWCIDNGHGPMPAHITIRERLEEGRNPYNEPMDKRGAWYPAVPKAENPDVVFFAGCTASYRMQNLAKASVIFLNRCGVSTNIMEGDEWCCTSPALRTGQTGLTYRFAEHTIGTVEHMGAKAMVTACAGCYKTTVHDYGKFYAHPTFEVFHFAQYANKLLKEKKVKFTKEIKAKVTYHDPCHLGRHAKVYDEPREVIRSIPGVEFIEMKNIRESSRCCGAGGGYKSQYNDMATAIAVERVKEAIDTGADILATTCPFCVLNMTQAAKKIGAKIKVMDVSEMLAMATEPEAPAEAPKQ